MELAIIEKKLAMDSRDIALLTNVMITLLEIFVICTRN